jgi:quercetin dioxygenase-like cupin family protein
MLEMKFYRKGSGEKYTPFDHFDMTTQVIFNPETGSRKANCTLSTLGKRSGSSDEVHPDSDQIFYVLTGTLKVSAEGVLRGTAGPGDAVLVVAGDVHAVSNDGDGVCSYLAITVPPLEATH